MFFDLLANFDTMQIQNICNFIIDIRLYTKGLSPNFTSNIK